MDMNIELIKSAIPLLIAGAGITVEITALSVFFGMLIGIIVALARLSDFKILRWLGNVYVDFIRGTPLLIQIFLVYFALPSIIGSRVDAFFAAISACSINSGAYVAEVFRGGIQSIDVVYHFAPGFQTHHPSPGQRIHRHAEGFLPGIRNRL